MGYHIGAALSAEQRAELPAGVPTSTKVGVYGSQDVLCALLLAGYTQTGRPDANRVCAWVKPIQRDGLDWHRYYDMRNRPGRVAELIADTTDDCAWLNLEKDTMLRGLQRRGPGDEVLSGLVEFTLARNNFGGHGPGEGVDAAATADFAAAVAEVLPHLEPSSWYQELAAVAAVARFAAERGVGLHVG